MTWLDGFDRDRLLTLLQRRPDVSAGEPPRTLTGLALRLERPESLTMALVGVPLPVLQLAEAAMTVGTVEDLRTLVDGDIDAALGELVALGIVRVSDGELDVANGLRELFPAPLGLGPSLTDLSADVTVEELRRILDALGLPRVGRRDELRAAVLAHLLDPQRVRDLVDRAEPLVRRRLIDLAEPQDPQDRDWLWQDDWSQARLTATWGAAHGLLWRRTYTDAFTMPGEIAIALRGSRWRAPFMPDRPALPTTPAGPPSAPSGEFLEQAVAVLDHVVGSPVTVLRSGGVGTRELGRLVKATRSSESSVRLVLALADALGLLGYDDGRLGASSGFGPWRALDPADQLMSLLQTWWSLGAVPSEAPTGQNRAALTVRSDCPACRHAREAVLGVLAALPAGQRTTADAVGAVATWDRPLAHLSASDGAGPLAGPDRVAALWQEGEQVGVIAGGALTDLGRALVAGTDLAVEVARVVPAVGEQGVFGADLTVMVAGSPSARITTLLDCTADRESRGAAVVWRFSPASVRRALDAGREADGLEQELATIATAPLPQPLTYLLRDVGRRHGSLRIRPAACIVTGVDPALLAEVAADRRLVALGLRPVAPTVLLAAAGPDPMLVALRKAGYLPLPEDADGHVVAVSARAAPPPLRYASRSPRSAAVDPATVLAQLLDGGTDAGAQVRSATMSRLARQAPVLDDDELRLLAAAIDSGGAVQIEYSASGGAVTRRVIRSIVLSGNRIDAWCDLRADERFFALDGIQRVAPAQ